MKKYIALLLLALLTITCVVVEGLVENISPAFIQLNGLLTILCTGAFTVTWLLTVQADTLAEN